MLSLKKKLDKAIYNDFASIYGYCCNMAGFF